MVYSSLRWWYKFKMVDVSDTSLTWWCMLNIVYVSLTWWIATQVLHGVFVYIQFVVFRALKECVEVYSLRYKHCSSSSTSLLTVNILLDSNENVVLDGREHCFHSGHSGMNMDLLLWRCVWVYSGESAIKKQRFHSGLSSMNKDLFVCRMMSARHNPSYIFPSR